MTYLKTLLAALLVGGLLSSCIAVPRNEIYQSSALTNLRQHVKPTDAAVPLTYRAFAPASYLSRKTRTNSTLESFDTQINGVKVKDNVALTFNSKEGIDRYLIDPSGKLIDYNATDEGKRVTKDDNSNKYADSVRFLVPQYFTRSATSGEEIVRFAPDPKDPAFLYHGVFEGMVSLAGRDYGLIVFFFTKQMINHENRVESGYLVFDPDNGFPIHTEMSFQGKFAFDLTRKDFLPYFN